MSVATPEALSCQELVELVTDYLEHALEPGDLRRFDSPRQLMGYLGLVPGERSTGDTVRRLGITKAGNGRVRRVLVESAWCYRHLPRIGKAKHYVHERLPPAVRDIAAKAGVGMGTIYRHFPTRADLIIAVYRHQVEACAEAGPALLASGVTPHAALGRWINLFVDFLVTKHGLAAVLQSDDAGFDALHAYFLDRLVPVCTQLLDAAAAAGEIRPGMDAYALMRGVANLCIGADSDPRYDARRLVDLLIAGLLRT